jgi:hypothetical protein
MGQKDGVKAVYHKPKTQKLSQPPDPYDCDETQGFVKKCDSLVTAGLLKNVPPYSLKRRFTL